LELGERNFALAQRQNEPAALLLGHFVVGEILYVLGELPSAREHLEQGMALFGPTESTDPRPSATTQDTWLECFSVDALVLWHLGYPHQPLAMCEEVLTLAKRRGHPLSLASTLCWVTLVYQCCRDIQRTRELAEMSISLAPSTNFRLGWRLERFCMAGRSSWRDRETKASFKLADSLRINLEVGRPHWLALLAEAYGKVGQAEKGLSLVSKALALADKTGEQSHQPELFRLKGELTLQRTGLRDSQSETQQQDAEACFQKAIEIARRQQAKSLELRAAMSLSRLRQHQGRLDEARTALAEIYNWFTEGFDTADLKDAKALLDELAI
jgi:tetratricopeptide (TPR) repeat protein